MLESFIIFTRGGTIVWEYKPESMTGQPIDHLIQEVLLSERKNQNQYIFRDFLLRWSFLNELDLVFVSVQLRLLPSGDVTNFLNAVKLAFADHFSTTIKEHEIPSSESLIPFENIFQSLVKKLESSVRTSSANPNVEAQRAATNVESEEVDSSPSTSAGLTGEQLEAQRLARFAESLDRKKNPRQPNTPGKGKKTDESGNASGKGKKMTKWSDSKLSKEEQQQLDMSEGATTQDSASLRKQAEAVHGSAPSQGDRYWETAVENTATAKQVQDQEKSAVWGFLSALSGRKSLTAEDLAPIRKSLTDHLVKKNVAPHVADQLVSSVTTSLEGQTLGSFSTVYSAVSEGLKAALRRLLTPKKDVDVLEGVANAQRAGRPYSIVFCGVNGVGKSTSLAKIAAFFTSQGLKVGIAACDTFRSGAIEQLRTHSAALGVPLYDKGYGKDEASVAADGILRARKDNLDVILIDTAGRMQGNTALMKGLAKLMNINEPDLVLFVGEALVGNDGCDQLINFNRALEENSGKAHPRLIDGIVLTKFDTIDDKVGAAISMTYSTGQPIVFVGVGQSYRDLKKPSPEMLISALMK